MKLYWPVRVEDGIFISQRFGEKKLDYSQFGWIGHNGIDYAGNKGTPIYAIHDGWIVEQTAKETGYGLRVSQRIESDGKFYLFTYGHFERLELVKDVPYNWNDKSTPVRAGQKIGYMDSTGYSTGNHLHLSGQEMTSDGITINQNNGYGGAFNFEPLMAGELEKPIMSNVLLVKKGGEYGFYSPAINESALISEALHYGIDIPKTPDGLHVDFAALDKLLTGEIKLFTK